MGAWPSDTIDDQKQLIHARPVAVNWAMSFLDADGDALSKEGGKRRNGDVF
jgi:hypothetical protein